MMDAERLAEIKARVEATPRGPWDVEYFGDKGYPQRVGNQAALLIAETFEGGTGLRPIPEFIAHARTDVPDLLAEVERLKKALTEACDQMIASDIDEANAVVDLDQTKARVRELLASMRTALSAGDHATLAIRIGQIAAHVDGGVQ